jgi:hypothetical protein
LVDFFDLSDFDDLSAFGLEASVALVSVAESVLVLALSDFLEAASVLVFSLVLLVLVFGDVAAFSDGLVFVADSAGLFAVEAGAAVALAAGFGWTWGVPIGEALGVALAEGVMVAAAVAAGVALAATLAVAAGVAAGVALGSVEALLEVVVAPVVVLVVPEVMPTLKFGTVTP